MEYTPINKWAEDDKPREKLMSKGAESLSDSELIAILLSTGSREKSAVDLAREILQLSNQNLNKLGRLNIKDLQQIKGVGSAKAVTIVAAMELGKRRQYADDIFKEKINSSQDAAKMLVPLMRDFEHEKFCVLYLNQSNRLISHEFISSGGVAGTYVDVKMILRQAIRQLCSNIIVAHNHPSGNKTPSEADKKMTQKLKDAAALLDVKLIDHVIVAEQDYFSFADEGIL